MDMDPEELQEILIDNVENTAEWRAHKATEYPEVKRNAQCAQALNALAESLNAMPTDHPKLRWLWWALFRERPKSKPDAEELDIYFSREESQLISRYGFDCPEDGNAEEFLSELIAELERASGI